MPKEERAILIISGKLWLSNNQVLHKSVYAENKRFNLLLYKGADGIFKLWSKINFWR
jgi:hypothetical protein